ncbi:MAG TPA: nucleotidyltransferase domain-containing protein [Symbiobacteriaceae bacterium]|nr:nucleotidyltransferase domain-containing protein [Symbiobacteriaceae bacterium]
MQEWLLALVDELATGDEVGWLVSGSIARGEAHAHSDVDLTRFTADGPSGYRAKYGLQYWQGRLVSVTNRTVEVAQRELESVSGAIWAVEGLRQARILRDPTGAIATLQAQAHAFDWAPLRPTARDWVSYRIAHAAEEVHKLLGLRQQGDLGGLANATMGLNLTIGYAMAVDREVLFRSENRWIDQVLEAVGAETPWADAFRQSLGLTALGRTSAPIWGQSAGALQLYAETVILVAQRMHAADRTVALEAVARIRREGF